MSSFKACIEYGRIETKYLCAEELWYFTRAPSTRFPNAVVPTKFENVVFEVVVECEKLRGVEMEFKVLQMIVNNQNCAFGNLKCSDSPACCWDESQVDVDFPHWIAFEWGRHCEQIIEWLPVDLVHQNDGSNVVGHAFGLRKISSDSQLQSREYNIQTLSGMNKVRDMNSEDLNTQIFALAITGFEQLDSTSLIEKFDKGWYQNLDNSDLHMSKVDILYASKEGYISLEKIDEEEDPSTRITEIVIEGSSDMRSIIDGGQSLLVVGNNFSSLVKMNCLFKDTISSICIIRNNEVCQCQIPSWPNSETVQISIQDAISQTILPSDIYELEYYEEELELIEEPKHENEVAKYLFIINEPNPIDSNCDNTFHLPTEKIMYNLTVSDIDLIHPISALRFAHPSTHSIDDLLFEVSYSTNDNMKKRRIYSSLFEPIIDVQIDTVSISL
jgi:hypothetical protein